VKTDTLPVTPSVALVKKSVYHVVKTDESLKGIADLYHVKPEDLKKWNNLTETETVAKGQVLVIHSFVPKEK